MAGILLENKPQISAEPTKMFFVQMLTRDIQLEQAVLDLVDNSVDGAKGLKRDGATPFDGMSVRIEFNKEQFRIIDNCGGFSSETARTYAFRFGKPAGSPRTSHSIGQFGVGMKRALFKFGNHFTVKSATTEDEWAVDVDVPQWEAQDGWSFPWAEFGKSLKIETEDTQNTDVSTANPGTEILVTNLRPEVGWKFSTPSFQNNIIGLIKSKHRQFIAGGLSITVNGQRLDATSLFLLVTEDTKDKFNPGAKEFIHKDEIGEEVAVRIIVGVGPSTPRDAGWYVICNGRVILEADRRNTTGWGVVEEETSSVYIPSFHNQFARFRGIVTFDSDDSTRVPWNTTKTDVDQDNAIWQKTLETMIEMMRPVITFLNDLDKDIDEHTREKSPLLEYVTKAKAVKSEELPRNSVFVAPARGSLTRGPKTIKIQYSRPIEEIEFLMNELSLTSAKDVGQKSFDLTYERMGGE